jgi:4-diphosphocytidyl-2-C-methyl-D-erythritol kinase
VPTVLRYTSYGKLNLYLEVLGRRDDGFHNIETIFQTVSLGDELTFQEHASELRLTCSRADLETGSGNLVVRAAALLRERTGCRRGAQIHLDKRLPVAGGMAGGSGNAAAALVALNRLWGLGLSDVELQALGLELGSDVPYCLVGGTAAATGRGEAIVRLPELAQGWFVLVHPQLSVSAASVYRSGRLTYSAEAPTDGRTPAFQAAIDALATHNWPAVVFNRMEGVVFHDHPELAQCRDDLLALGCVAAAMSGSGPTVFGVCLGEQEARDVAARLEGVATSVVRPVQGGVAAG